MFYSILIIYILENWGLRYLEYEFNLDHPVLDMKLLHPNLEDELDSYFVLGSAFEHFCYVIYHLLFNEGHSPKFKLTRLKCLIGVELNYIAQSYFLMCSVCQGFMIYYT